VRTSASEEPPCPQNIRTRQTLSLLTANVLYEQPLKDTATKRFTIKHAQAEKNYWQVIRNSGIARVLCALGQGTIFRSLSTKTTEFELKNRCKSAEEANTEHLL